MMKQFLFVLGTALTFTQVSLAQCEVRATSNLDTIVCGDAAILNVFGKGQGPVVFSENFNSGSPSGWAFTQQASFNNPCSPNGVDGTPHIWMGNLSAVPRALETNPYNFSTATAGATICFDMLMAEQGGTSPCEGPDEPDEGIYLQYKIGNGPWVTIHYFDPNGGTDPQYINWNNLCFQLPQAALTSNVSIRWFQDNDSGADYDHWGIDNVQIYFNDPTFTISVTNPQGQVFTFPQGSSGGDVTPVTPRVTTDYYFSMQNTSGTICRDTVRIVVKDPFFEISAGRDTTVCAGKCVTLNSSAKVVKSYEKTVTFSNNQLTPIATGIAGAATTINVAVAGMNNTTLQNGMIQSVCIANLGFFGFNLFPPSQQTIGDLRIRLLCPDGTAIVLVPAGVTTSTTPLTGYTNTCFTIGSTTNIATGTPPYTGSYQPNQPFNNLSGCSTNGVWTMEISTANAASLGQGTFLGWSITLNDPEISYNGNFNWSPTTDMTNPTSPTPTICPTASRDYVLAVSDTANCKTVRDTVRVNVDQNCCNFSISASATQPSCGASNGAISVTASPSGNYSYLWNDGNTAASRTNLPAGTYRVTVTDVANNNCEKDTVIILNSNSTLALQLTNPVNPGCGAADGSVTLALSGGTAPYSVAITVNGNTQTITVPTATSQVIPNLAGGTYTIVVTDAQQCQQTQTFTLTAANAPTIVSVTASAQACGGNDGTATVTATGGTGTLTYLWSNQQTTATITGLASGLYTVTVRDANNCTATGSVTVTSAANSILLTLAAVQPTCFGVADGSVTATVTGGTGNIAYLWNNGSTVNALTGLGAGTYTVVVTDAAGCTQTDSATLVNSQQVVVDLGADRNFCTGGNTTLEAPADFDAYSWSTGDTTRGINVTAAGQYAVTVTNANGCSGTDAVNITVSDKPEVTLPADTTIYDNNSTVLSPTITGNKTNAIYQWKPATGLSCDDCEKPVATPADSTTYLLIFTDANGCVDSATTSISVISGARIYMPNVFSPNGDNNNDILFPKSIGVKDIGWKVFNRWGELVFETKDLNIGWDGTFKGEAQPSGVYIYTMSVTFRNNTAENYNGSVTLIR